MKYASGIKLPVNSERVKIHSGPRGGREIHAGSGCTYFVWESFGSRIRNVCTRNPGAHAAGAHVRMHGRHGRIRVHACMRARGGDKSRVATRRVIIIGLLCAAWYCDTSPPVPSAIEPLRSLARSLASIARTANKLERALSRSVWNGPAEFARIRDESRARA